jgi:anti-sigma factor RsiW
MSELELQLTRLGRELDFPAERDLTRAVVRRLAEPPERRFWSRRVLVVALAALVVAVAAVFAVPPARSAILDWLGIGSAEIRIVDELPEVETVTLAPGERVSLSRAHELEPGLLDPHLDGVGKPDAVFVQDLQPGTPVTYVWGGLDRPRLLLTQVRGRFYFEKLVHAGETAVVATEVNGADAAWIKGEHVLYYESGRTGGTLPSRLAKSTLVWSRGPVTLRLEGDMTREEAERIARTVR